MSNKDSCELTIDQRLVASSDPNDEETSFSGAARLKLGISPAGLFVDPDPLDNISSPNLLRSATIAPVMSPSMCHSLLEHRINSEIT
jgi:hypothetical protein